MHYLKPTMWWVAFICAICLWAWYDFTQYQGHDVFREEYCEMTALYRKDARAGVPKDWRRGWPEWNPSVNCSHEPVSRP